eukprot:GHVU01160094.1.p1 GENE.GHVU01160094.1~~GHVU01160094.1.p1  ORF type:complete len:262 (-),score=26.01 GHVU01160094.1:334-1119(-)
MGDYGGGGYGGGSSEDRIARVYVGNLPSDVERRDLEQLFNKYGKVLDVSIKETISNVPFAFLEFNDSRDADDAIHEMNGYEMSGNRLRVEKPFASRGRKGERQPFQGPATKGGYRVTVTGLPHSGSWQDLKDHMRRAGECVYADVFKDGTGVAEFRTMDAVDKAVRTLDGSRFKSHEGEFSHINVVRNESRSRSRSGGRSRSKSRDRRGGGGDRERPPSWDPRDYRGSSREGRRESPRNTRRRERSRGSYKSRSRSRSRSR